MRAFDYVRTDRVDDAIALIGKPETRTYST